MILAGDIGGTKTDLALYELKDEKLILHVKKQFKNSRYTSLTDILDDFADICPLDNVKSACFALAGLVEDFTCKITNLPWNIKGKELQNHLNIKNIILINDLQATAYGMLNLNESDFVSLNPKAKTLKANCGVIAAGTGLGEAILFYDEDKYHAIATEGGHTDFAPQNRVQDELLIWLRKRYKEHVSYERILCGEGIYTLYDFLAQNNDIKDIDISQYENKSAMISHFAIEKKDILCIKTLKLFAEIYAAEAGNLALKCNARGGVYIGGGIAPKILPFITSEEFMKSFTCKGRFSKMLSEIEVKVSLNPQTALLGAAYFAKTKIG